MKRNEVGISEIKAHLRCRLAGFWSAPPPRGLGLEPIVSRTALAYGRLIHAALQIGYDEGTPFAEAFETLYDAEEAQVNTGALFAEQLEDLKKTRALGVAMMEGYQRWAAIHDEGVRFLALETEFRNVRIGAGRPRLRGRMDAIIERDDGIWPVDFKTTKYSETDWTHQDLQATAYIYAARKLYGPKVRGLIYRFMLKKAPLPYDELILKKGTLTQRKDLGKITTYEEWAKAMAVATLQSLVKEDFIFAEQVELAFGAPYSDYMALLEEPDYRDRPWYSTFNEAHKNVRRLYYQTTQTLKGESKFFWEVEEYRTDEQIKLYLKHVIAPAAREMTSRRRGRWVGPTGLGAAFAVCSNCSFKTPCRLYFDGADYRTCLREEYQLRDIYRPEKKGEK